MPGQFDFAVQRGLSLTQSSVPWGTRKRKPLAAMVALSMSSAMARLCEKRSSVRWRRRVRAATPVAVVGAGHGAGTQHALQLVALELGDIGDRRFERDLHFGQRRDRHPQRQLFVSITILAHIAVGRARSRPATANCAGPRSGPSMSQACGRSTAM